MSIDEPTHVALPKLYGAPAYARPAKLVDESERPFDPDDLPIAAELSEEERALLDRLPARAWAPGGGIVVRAGEPAEAPREATLEPRPFGLKSLAGRLLRG